MYAWLVAAMEAALTREAFIALMRYAGVSAATVEAMHLIYDRVIAFISTPAAMQHILDGLNNITERYGLTLTALNPDAIKADLDRFLTEKINEKLGTEFTTLEGVDRDKALTEVGRVLAKRMNEASGSKIDNLYPPEELPAKIGAELVRQLETGEDGIIPRESIQETERVVMEKLPGYHPPRIPEDAGKAAKSRARQKRWRAKNKQIWVTRT